MSKKNVEFYINNFFYVTYLVLAVVFFLWGAYILALEASLDQYWRDFGLFFILALNLIFMSLLLKRGLCVDGSH